MHTCLVGCGTATVAQQVESDIAPYKGLLLGLFFMSVGMEMNAQLFLAKWVMMVMVLGTWAVCSA